MMPLWVLWVLWEALWLASEADWRWADSEGGERMGWRLRREGHRRDEAPEET